MHTNNNRRHTRRSCEVPLEILAEAVRLSGRVMDASRSGVRLRVPGAPLGLYRMAPPALVGRQVGRILGIEFQARFHPERLGSLLSKRLRPVRIGQCEASSADVELGCVVDPPLTDDEAAMLGLGLPTLLPDGQEGELSLEARAPQVRSDLSAPASPARPTPPPSPRIRIAAPAPSKTTPRHAPGAPLRSEAPPPRLSEAPALRAGSLPDEVVPRVSLAARESWRAYVHPSGTRRIPPFVARMELVSTTGVQVKVLDRSLLNLNGGVDVASTMAALGDAYGSEVALRLVDGATHLWTGPARIEMVEVGQAAPHPVTLWLSFARPLRTPERRALELG